MDDGKIICRLCGDRVHVIKKHLTDCHPYSTIEDYQKAFPSDPIYSRKAQELMDQKRLEKRKEIVTEPAKPIEPVTASYAGGFNTHNEALHSLFRLAGNKAAFGHRGNEIPITVAEPPESLAAFVPEEDENYIFQVELLKTALLGIETNIPTYLWGNAGTGKTTLVEQVCAITKRPFLRVQHTRDTESAHIAGQWMVKDGHTVFELGPLAYCMKHGLLYLADEYDFAMPAILAVYQPVLEGKALVIKEADEANRIIKPHPMFRFVATGNTNGTGDETGLYQGTMIQNAANYERFGIVEEVHYMEGHLEVGVITGQGGVPSEIAHELVNYARMIREAFANGKIGLPISPRALINAALSGRRLGSFKRGLALAYINRLSRVDQEAAREVLNRTSLS